MTCPVVLDRTSKAWEALRPGPVYDMDTGEHLIDLTPDKIEAARAALAMMRERGIGVPFDYAHAIQRNRNGEPAKTYGTVADVSVDEAGKLLVVPDLTSGGAALLDGSEGAYWLSPAFGAGPLHDPETGEVLAPLYIESITITPTPRQNGLAGIALSKDVTPPAMLARLNSLDEIHAFREGMEAAAAKAISATFGHSPEYLSVRQWEGDEGGTMGVSYYFGEPERHWLMQLDWSRDEAGVVTASNPVEAVERTIIEPKQVNTEPAPVAVSLAKEGGLHMQTVDITALVAPLDAGVELSKAKQVSIEVPDEAAEVLEKAVALSRDLRSNLDEAKQGQAAAVARATKAEAKAELAEDAGIQLAKANERIEALEAKQAEADAKAAQLAKEKVAAEQVDALIGDGSLHLSKRDGWVNRALTLGREGFDALVADFREDGTLKAGKHAPSVIDRPAGASVGKADAKAEAAALNDRITALSKERSISRGEAMQLILSKEGA